MTSFDDGADTGGRFSNLTLLHKFVGLSVILLSLMLAASVYTFYQTESLSAEEKPLLEVIEPLAHEETRIAEEMADEALSVERALRYGGPQINDPSRAEQQRARFAKQSHQVSESLKLAYKHVKTYEGKPLRTDIAVALGRLELEIEAVMREHADYDAAAQQLLTSSEAAANAPVQTLEGKVASEEEDLIKSMERMTAEVNRLAENDERKAEAMESKAFFASAENLGLAVAAFLLGTVLSLMMTRRMLSGVRRLIAGTEEVRKGNLDISLPTQSTDEIGQLTNAFSGMVGELRQKATMRQTFSSYMDPRVVDRLLGNNRAELEAGEKRKMTVFFSDLQGFSAISETLTATSLVKLINRYLHLASEPIRDHQGVIDKYIGDAVMAYWGEPFTEGNHVLNACRAALAQRQQLNVLQAELPELLGLRRGAPNINIRIGLSTGDVVVGSIGSSTSKSFTIMGDTVNIASRLEGANKLYGTLILADEETVASVKNLIEAREIDLLAAVGKSEAVRVFEILGETGSVDAERLELRDMYQQGLIAYRNQDWAKSETSFNNCLRLAADDMPSYVFLERIRAFRVKKPESNWDGVWHSEAK